MQYGVIAYPKSTNIGDEIQSIAASNLLPHTHHYIPRESLDRFHSREPTKVICNGYFMYKHNRWPPSKSIIPLFISLHVAPTLPGAKSIINKALADYYKAYGPVGCRDHSTTDRFHKKGIDAYFSSCLTLTMGNIFRGIPRNNNILLVDAFAKFANRQYIKRNIEKVVPKSWRGTVQILSHSRSTSNLSLDQRISSAMVLLEKYASAKLVITSRIHCALPCLAFGTPVYFVDIGYDNELARARFGGILELVRKISPRHFPFSKNSRINNYRRLMFSACSLPWHLKPAVDFINWNQPEDNPSDISDLAKRMRQTVDLFISTN